jgi:hypothetical protein
VGLQREDGRVAEVELSVSSAFFAHSSSRTREPEQGADTARQLFGSVGLDMEVKGQKVMVR